MMPETKHKDTLNEKKSVDQSAPIYIRIVSFLKPLFSFLGADPEMVYLIVRYKFLIDSRKDNPLEGVTGQLKEDKNPFFGTLWIYLVMGAFLLFTFIIPSILYQVVIFFFFLFVMLIATLVSQFSTILLDLKSQTFLASKPISKRTLQVAKSTHIGIYIMSFSLSLSLAFFVGSFFFHGIRVGTTILLLTIIATAWSYIFTTLIYGVALVHLDGERLKNMIVYFQITLMTVTFLSYYLFGQIYNLVDLEGLSFQLSGSFWEFILIPVWFTASVDIVLHGLNGTNLIMLGLLVVSTIILIVGFMYYSDFIDQNLQKMNTNTERAQIPSMYQRTTQRIFCTNTTEKALFNYYWHFLREDREFKTRLYPAIISNLTVPVMLIYSIVFAGRSVDMSYFDFGLLAYIPYAILLLIPNVLLMIQYSKDYRARWIYETLPNNDTKLHIRAASKAVLSRLFFPIYFIVSLLVIAFSLGQADIVVLVNGWFVLSLVVLFTFKKVLKNIPFSQLYDMSSQNIGCIFQVLTFISVAFISIAMALIQMFVPYGEWILLAILLGLNLFFIRNKKV